jgi:hypothetical protein
VNREDAKRHTSAGQYVRMVDTDTSKRMAESGMSQKMVNIYTPILATQSFKNSARYVLFVTRVQSKSSYLGAIVTTQLNGLSGCTARYSHARRESAGTALVTSAVNAELQSAAASARFSVKNAERRFSFDMRHYLAPEEGKAIK